MRQLFARLHTALAWLIFLSGVVELYQIAQSVFGGGTPADHGAFGRILFLNSLELLIASLVCRSSRLNIGLSLLVPVLLFAQGMFVYLPAFGPAVRALHGVNGLVNMGLCYVLAAGRPRAVVPAGQPTPVPARRPCVEVAPAVQHFSWAPGAKSCYAVLLRLSSPKRRGLAQPDKRAATLTTG